MTISIIIPVYNSSKYLNRCIESILNQSYEDLEIIFINDGSTDDSLQVINSYIKVDERIVCLNQKNEGVSSARNKGLNMATGDLICFVDSDDYIESNYIVELYNDYHIRTDCDLVFQSFKRILPEEKKSNKGSFFESTHFENIFVESTDLYTLFEKQKIHEFGYLPTKIFNRKIIEENQLRFEKKVHLYEDTIFTLNYCLFCRSIYFSSHKNYNYIYYEGSLSNKTQSFDREIGSFYVLFDIIKNKYKVLENSLYANINIFVYSLLNKSINALYLNHMERNHRLNRLKSIHQDALKFYTNFKSKEVSGGRVLINNILFLKKYSCYDFILKSLFNLKKLIK